MDLEATLQQENLNLKARLEESESALDAIRSGEVDAIVVRGKKGDQLYSLISPEHPYKIFIEKMLEAALIISKQGTILYANQSFFEMIDLPSERIIGASIVDFVIEAEKSYFSDLLEKEGRKRSETTLLNSKHKKISVTFSVSKGTWEDSENLCLLISDVSALKKAQKLIQASEEIAKSFSGTPAIASALKDLINELNSCLGWEVAALWSWNQEQSNLICLEVACISAINGEEFAKKTKQMKTKKGSIPDRTWTSYHPISIADIAEEFTFSSRKEIVDTGLHGFLSFPIYQNRKLTGIVELFRRLPFHEEIDDTLYTLLSSIGITIGLYLQRKDAEETNAQFLQLLQHSSNGIYRVNNQGIVKSWNPGAESIYGWTPEEIVGAHISKLYPSEQKNAFAELVSKLLDKKSIENVECKGLHKDATPRCVKNTYGTIRNHLGELIEICVIAEDMSAKKHALESLKTSEDRFQTFIEITDEWLWELDKVGNFLFSNNAVEKILGYETEEIIGKNILYFLSPENMQNTQEQFEKNIIQKKGWYHQVMHFIHKKDGERWIECNAIQMLNSSNKPVGYRGVGHDITSARSAEKIKNEFISTVSHELRTPLTSIHGALTLLQSPESPLEEMRELLSLAQRNSERLIKLVNDVLDVEKIGLGKLEYFFNKVNLREVITEAIDSSAIVAKKFDVNIVTADSLPDAEVHGDYHRLIQVMLNLLSNGIKFTPAKGLLEVSLQNLEDTVRVSVRDHGPGIPKEFEPKLFEKFAQADSSSTREFGGTGLGLNISQGIIEAHKGKIQYTTKIGEGTTFFFELPKYSEG